MKPHPEPATLRELMAAHADAPKRSGGSGPVPLVSLHGAGVSFGPTVALADVDLPDGRARSQSAWDVLAG